MSLNAKPKALLSWALYDWGNSAFSALIQTFVFAAYFTKEVAADQTLGAAQWGFISGFGALIVALCGPILGAVADQGQHRKWWIAGFTYLCIISTALLWYIQPNPAYAAPGLLLVCLGIIGAELAFVFYNAMLPGLSGPEHIGRWSGYGWCMGYIGGMACLVVALFAFIDEIPWIPLDRTNASHIRATFPLVAVWYFLFSLPMFLFTPDTSGKGTPFRGALTAGLRQLRQTLANIRCYKHLVRFLIAHMFYTDGLTTLFAFGGIYAATLLEMDARQILLFGIAMHVTSGIGAASFARVDDWLGSRRLIILSLLGLIIPTAFLLTATNPKTFWILGLTLGIFVGPVQSASRSLMARMAPKHLLNEMFGFFALSGKATAFIGPMLVGWIILMTGSLRAGMATILVFYFIGLALMFTIPKEIERS